MALRAILFDKDGTLIDFDRTWYPVMAMLAAEAAPDDPAQAAVVVVDETKQRAPAIIVRAEGHGRRESGCGASGRVHAGPYVALRAERGA